MLKHGPQVAGALIGAGFGTAEALKFLKEQQREHSKKEDNLAGAAIIVGFTGAIFGILNGFFNLVGYGLGYGAGKLTE